MNVPFLPHLDFLLWITKYFTPLSPTRLKTLDFIEVLSIFESCNQIRIPMKNPQITASVVFCGKVVVKKGRMWEIMGNSEFI